jgi:hypothetical protein
MRQSAAAADTTFIGVQGLATGGTFFSESFLGLKILLALNRI